MKFNCLIADKTHESILPLLASIGIKGVYRPEIKRPEILQLIPEYEGLIIRSKTKVDQELIQQAKKLKFVGRAGAGIDQLDVQALEARGIHIVNAPEGNRDAVGEHAVGMLLCLFNKIHIADAQVRQKIWDREGNRGEELAGKTVGIIGYGNMGRAFAKRLKGFEVTVLAYDKYKDDYTDEYASQATMAELFARADILSLHVPLTDETRFMVDVSYMQSFKKNIFLLNTARGELIRMETLVDLLSSGKLRGVATDVLENEKLNAYSSTETAQLEKLIQSDRIIFTPHVAGWSFQSYEKINRVLVEKIKSLNLT